MWHGRRVLIAAVVASCPGCCGLPSSILVIAWRRLSEPDARYTDLGPGRHDRLAPRRRKRQLIAELERLSGMKATLQDAA
jgi:hypothetical protein